MRLEINEVFAAQVIPSARGLGLDAFDDGLTPHGGGPATTSIGLETMCDGIAMILERLS